MKNRVMKAMIAITAGAALLQFGGCGGLGGGGSGGWLRFLGDFVGDAIWLRAID